MAVHLAVASVLALTDAGVSLLFVVLLASGMLCVANVAARSDSTFPTRHRPLYVMIGAGISLPLISMFFMRLSDTDEGFVLAPFRLALFSLIAIGLAWSIFTGFRHAIAHSESTKEPSR